MAREEIESSWLHEASFEAYEERLAFSADPLGELLLHGGVAANDIALELPVAVPQQSGLQTQANAGQAWSDVQYARANYNLTGAGQTVAIIDTGIAYDHVALGGTFGTGSRVVGGWDFAENDANPYDDGPTGFHGTHVAGIVGARNNNYAGVATGVDLVGLRVFDDNGNGNFSWVESALQWVHANRNSFANPITTVNLSLGATWNANTVPNWANLEDEFAQLEADGIFIAVSAGNSFSSYNVPGVSYPAASPYVVPVASVNSSGQFSTFSQRNANVLAAPGQSITSTVPDHLFGADGVKNDFAVASGTSMAAPWVAGASTLVREAMQRLGYTNITQDTIYNHLRATADTLFDSVTNANYSRVNLRQALDSLLTADDFGNSSNYAFHMGTVGATAFSLSGGIQQTSDVDCFSFTAGSSGTAKFQLTSGFGSTAQWQVEGGASGTGSSFNFNVTSGQTYQIRLGGGGATGTYQLSLAVEPAGWGQINFGVYAQKNVVSESWYSVTAANSGYFTAESWFDTTAGNIDLELYDANRILLGSSNNTTNSERIDQVVTAGQTLWVRAVGTNSNVTFRCTNLVSAEGNQIRVNGTSGDDLFIFLAGTTQHRVAINGVGYDFQSATYNEVYLTDVGGTDTYVMVGTTGDETATLSAGSAIVSTSFYSSVCTAAENIYVYGQGGEDRVTFTDSSGYDAYYGTPQHGHMIGGGNSLIAGGFDSYQVNFSSGGFNQAWLFGSVGDDTFTGSATTASMTSTGFAHYVNGQNTCVATGGAGSDLAILNDSAGNDTLNGVANAAALYSDTYYLRADAFDRVEARATSGNDTATLFDTTGNDYFAGSKVLTYMRSSDTINVATGFDTVVAKALSGGIDTADLYDSEGNDRFTILGRTRTLDSTDYKVQVENFRTVKTYAGNGGFDTVLLYDLANSDALNGRANRLTVTNNDTVENYGFEKAVAYARTGQRPRNDVAAVDYLFSKIGF